MKSLLERMSKSADRSELMSVLFEAADHLSCGALLADEAKALAQVVINQLDHFNDREEALNFVSNCATALGTTHGIDLCPIVRLVPELREGELIFVINILANSEDRTHLLLMTQLSNHENEEVSEEAKLGCLELIQRAR